MKPIVFSTPMVQAILNTKPGVWPAEPIDKTKPYKWQTRRPVNTLCTGRETGFEANLTGAFIRFFNKGNPCLWSKSSPYRVGDVLYVRETFVEVPGGGYLYRADPMYDGCGKGDFSWDWKPSIRMPREAARLFLKVKNVRADHLREISLEGKIAEGFCDCSRAYPCDEKDICNKDCFVKTWDALYAGRDYPWEVNPWVWVTDFERLAESSSEVCF